MSKGYPILQRDECQCFLCRFCRQKRQLETSNTPVVPRPSDPIKIGTLYDGRYYMHHILSHSCSFVWAHWGSRGTQLVPISRLLWSRWATTLSAKACQGHDLPCFSGTEAAVSGFDFIENHAPYGASKLLAAQQTDLGNHQLCGPSKKRLCSICSIPLHQHQVLLFSSTSIASRHVRFPVLQVGDGDAVEHDGRPSSTKHLWWFQPPGTIGSLGIIPPFLEVFLWKIESSKQVRFSLNHQILTGKSWFLVHFFLRGMHLGIFPSTVEDLWCWHGASRVNSSDQGKEMCERLTHNLRYTAEKQHGTP